MPTSHAANPESDQAIRVRALEAILTEKGLIDPKALDALVDTYEHKIGPRNGAKVVARAWVDPAYKQRLLTDASAAIKEFGFSGLQGEDMVVVGTRPMCTTSSSARCAPATRGRRSDCLPSGTNRHHTAHASSATRAVS